MKTSLTEKLNTIAERYQELSALLSEPETMADQTKFTAYSKEYAQLDPIVKAYRELHRAQETISASEMLIHDLDPEVREMAADDLAEAVAQADELETELKQLLIPKDPNDNRNVYLEIRAGTGGDEAAIFAGDLFRMYARYVERQGWQLELVSSSEGEHGGFKEVITRVSGQGVYGKLKFESGAHRVQRVPATEAQGRIHTSACTVAIMPEVESIDEIKISPDELRIDTYRASGAGGQHVNKTDSAIRITHIPTGTVVECQEERSQHKNRAKAMSLLQSRILDAAQRKQAQAEADTRKLLVGSGDRSERIRTYNYPQSRVTDHRINLTLYKLDEIMQGELDQVIEPLLREYQADQLTALGLVES